MDVGRFLIRTVFNLIASHFCSLNLIVINVYKWSEFNLSTAILEIKDIIFLFFTCQTLMYNSQPKKPIKVWNDWSRLMIDFKNLFVYLNNYRTIYAITKVYELFRLLILEIIGKLRETWMKSILLYGNRLKIWRGKNKSFKFIVKKNYWNKLPLNLPCKRRIDIAIHWTQELLSMQHLVCYL